jgi:hypothetical protein
MIKAAERPSAAFILSPEMAVNREKTEYRPQTLIVKIKKYINQCSNLLSGDECCL